MPQESYLLYTDEGAGQPTLLDTDAPVRKIIAERVTLLGLPAYDDEGQPVPYALFGGAERRIITPETTLAQTRYGSGSDLFLASRRRPWWETTFPPTLQPPHAAVPRRFPVALWLAVLPALLGAALILWPFGGGGAPGPAAAAGFTATPADRRATATLAPSVTVAATVPPTAVATPPDSTATSLPTTAPTNPAITHQVPTATRIPPTHAPTRPAGRARTFVPDPVRGYGRAASGQQQSSVSGRVVDRNNQPVTGACLYANNSGANTALHCTNDNGEYFIGDLGDSHWSIVLTYIPKPDTLRRQVVGVFDVDGTPGNQAVVNFLER